MFQIFSLIFMLFALNGCFLSFEPADKEIIWQKLPKENMQYEAVASDCDRIIQVARAQLGIPYHYGGMSRSGFDCSGYVCYVYQNALGKKLPHNAKAQSRYVQIYDLSQLEKGDLVFFDTSGKGKINHCGIYLGGGKFIHASSGKAYSVTTSDLTKGFYQRAFRWGGKVKTW